MSEATPDDVRNVIETSLSDAEIQAKLDLAKEDNERVNDTEQMDITQIRRIEELLASIKILSTTRERSTNQQSVGNASKSYEVGQIEQLRAELSQWDPSGTLGSRVIRDSDRSINTTAED